MATQNSIDNASYPFASTAITVDPGASGDSCVQFDINTTNEFKVGIDDDAGDAFKISQGNALGANDTMIISANGEINLPLQSSFFARNSVTDSNVTGDGTAYTVIFDTEVWDQNSDYNNGTGIFTAPVTGRYAFWSAVYLSGLDATQTMGVQAFVASNRTIYQVDCNVGANRDSSNYYMCSGGILVDMDATDTIYIEITVSNGGKTADIYGGIWSHTAFSGQLMA